MLSRIAAGLLIVTMSAVAATAQTNQDASGLTISWSKRYLEINGPNVPGGPIRTHYLEAYCRPGSTDRDWRETVIPHESRLVSAAPDGKRIELQDRLADGVVVSHVIEAGSDDVSFLVTASNPTTTESLAHWAQPCMRVDGFTGTDPAQSREVYPPYIRKCFVMLDGKLRRLPTKPWALKARYIPGQVYGAPGLDRNDLNPRPLSTLIPSSGLTGCYSADETMILAVAWEPWQEVFQGVITCMHCDFRIGGLKPGETKQIRGHLYIVPADEPALLKRFRQDFKRP